MPDLTNNGPPDVDPDRVAKYLEAKLHGDVDSPVVHEIEGRMEADQTVRDYVNDLLRLTEPLEHPERHPSMN